MSSRAHHGLKIEDLPKGDEAVVIIDDEELIRYLLGTALQQLGYEVQLCKNALEALVVIENANLNTHQLPNLVIMDAIIPGHSNKEFLHHLRETYPNIPVLVFSGYDDTHHLRDALGDVPNAFLRKPSSLEELAHSVRNLLDARVR